MDRTKREGDDDKNPLEWTVFGLSLLLVLSILAYLGYAAFKDNGGAPDLLIEHRHDPSEHAPYRYHITVHNTGGETAEEVNVELVLEAAGEEVETAELQLPFSPKNSKREGWVNFKTDPATADTLIARVISYKKP